MPQDPRLDPRIIHFWHDNLTMTFCGMATVDRWPVTSGKVYQCQGCFTISKMLANAEYTAKKAG